MTPGPVLLALLSVLELRAVGELVRIPSPLSVDVPSARAPGYLQAEPEEAGEWLPGRRVLLELAGGGALPAGRVDLLESRAGSWRWIASAESHGTAGEALPLAPGLALLHRSKASPGRWAWAAEPGAGEGMTTFRTIEVRRPATGGMVLAFAPGREDPIPADGGTEGLVVRVPFVPPGPAVVCSFTAEGDTCRLAGPHDLALELPGEVRLSTVRVVRLPGGHDPVLLEPGLSLVLPRKVRAEVVSAGEWLAIGTEMEKGWGELALVLEAGDGSKVRAEATDLPPPPMWSSLESRGASPVALLPLLLPDRERVIEPEALLVLLPRGRGPSVPIPIAVLSGDGEGIFRARDVPPGDYGARLLSAMAAGAEVEVTITGRGVEELEFAPGLIARGRVLDRSGGHPPGRATIQLLRMPGPGGKAFLPGTRGFEGLDWFRETTSDAEGEFRVALPGAGRYRLQALWGDSRARQEFAAPERTDEVRIGNVVVSNGSRVRGTIEACAGGEVGLTPMPGSTGDGVASPSAPGFFEYRRLAVDAAGRFEGGGFGGGSWLVGARCGGRTASVEPFLVDIPSEGVALLRLVAELDPLPPP